MCWKELEGEKGGGDGSTITPGDNRHSSVDIRMEDTFAHERCALSSKHACSVADVRFR